MLEPKPRTPAQQPAPHDASHPPTAADGRYALTQLERWELRVSGWTLAPPGADVIGNTEKVGIYAEAATLGLEPQAQVVAARNFVCVFPVTDGGFPDICPIAHCFVAAERGYKVSDGSDGFALAHEPHIHAA